MLLRRKDRDGQKLFQNEKINHIIIIFLVYFSRSSRIPGGNALQEF